MEKKSWLYISIGFVGLIIAVCLTGCWDLVGSGKETINGIEVPPAPDTEEDAASVAGVDSNENVVRDSVERMIAEVFGDDPGVYDKAMEYAIAEQRAMLEPTDENVKAFDILIICEDNDQFIDDLDMIDEAATDTGERVKAYLEAFSGKPVTINDEGC